MNTHQIASILHSGLLFLILTHAASAQRVLLEIDAPTGSLVFGQRVFDIGDRNGDQVGEIAVADSDDFAGQTTRWLRVYSGVDGTRLTERELTFALGGPVREAGDVDGDGDLDLLAWTSSRVFVFDAMSGQSFYDFQTSMSALETVTRSHDFDGDGVNDFVVGTDLGVQGGDRIAIHSGTNGAELVQLHEFDGAHEFCSALGRLGQTPLLVTAGDSTIKLYGDVLGAPAVEASFDSPPNSWLSSVTPVADVDGDGVEELLVTAIGTAPLAPGLGGVYMLSGADLQILWGYDAPAVSVPWLIPEIHVASMGSEVGDQDGDGIDDVCARVRVEPPLPNDPAPAVDDLIVFSGLDGSVIHVFESRRSGDVGRLGVTAIADMDGDGLREFVVAVGTDYYRRPQLLVIGSDGAADGQVGFPFCGPYALNSTGAPTTITAYRSTASGPHNLRLEASAAPPGVFGLFVASNEFVSAPFGSGPGLCLAGPIGRITQQGSTLQVGAGGGAELTLDASTLPLAHGFVPVVAGDVWAFQFWHRDVATPLLPSYRFSEGVYVQF